MVRAWTICGPSRRRSATAWGYALYLAQVGGKHPNAKPLKGFGGAGVLEVSEDYAGDTYRAVYTLTLPETVYVLHAFQKKSKQGIATPPREVATIRRRLKWAQEIHERRRSPGDIR